MSVGGLRELRTLAFGDLDAGLWGIACAPAGDEQHGTLQLVELSGGHTELVDAIFEQADAEGEWHARAAGIDLALSPVGAGGMIAIAEHGLESAIQPCSVRGSLVLEGTELELDCFGQHATYSRPPDREKFESLRALAAWFGHDDGLFFVSLRPKSIAGHDRDAVSSLLFTDGNPIPVWDPRLSTTYTASGVPKRASLELWLADPDEGAGDALDDDIGDDAGPRHFPRRAAGEAAGSAAQFSVAGLELRAELFRWHMSDREGTGVYVLARPT